MTIQTASKKVELILQESRDMSATTFTVISNVKGCPLPRGSVTAEEPLNRNNGTFVQRAPLLSAPPNTYSLSFAATAVCRYRSAGSVSDLLISSERGVQLSLPSFSLDAGWPVSLRAVEWVYTFIVLQYKCGLIEILNMR